MRVLTFAVIALAAALAAVPAAQAQRVKYSCVEVSPGQFVCSPAPHRP